MALICVLAEDAHAQRLPDLIVNRNLLVRSIGTETHDFSRDDCAVVEGCVKRTGRRKILRFEVSIANIGTGDLVIGDPDDNPDLFDYSECHGHYHMRGVMHWALLSRDGRQVRASAKRAFCMFDTRRYKSSAGESSGYDCDNQGLTAGWQDIYYRSLDCQWLDVTGVRRGDYLLKVTVNPRRRLQESRYSNNTILVPVRVR